MKPTRFICEYTQTRTHAATLLAAVLSKQKGKTAKVQRDTDSPGTKNFKLSKTIEKERPREHISPTTKREMCV